MSLYYATSLITYSYKLISRISNGHISAKDDPIHFMFGYRVGFSGSADRMALFRFTQIQDGGHMTWHDMIRKKIDNSRARSPFILATVILDFWQMWTSHDTGSACTIKKFDPENMGILLLCARSRNMPEVKCPLPVASKRRKNCCNDKGFTYALSSNCLDKGVGTVGQRGDSLPQCWNRGAKVSPAQ